MKLTVASHSDTHVVTSLLLDDWLRTYNAGAFRPLKLMKPLLLFLIASLA
jgi:hypothetical protein